jgi:hypothetical protein
MAEIERRKLIEPGAWRTLEWGWNATFSCRFFGPAGVQVKVRYGDGSWLGFDSQRTTLDGVNFKLLSVGGGSIAYARVQARVTSNTYLTWTYIAA